MKTCKEISDALVKAKKRLQSSFKLKEKSNRDGNIEYQPIFLATKDGHMLKITLEPCLYHPVTGEPLATAWTRFYVDEGPIKCPLFRLSTPGKHSNVVDASYYYLDTTDVSYILDQVLVYLYENYRRDIADVILPYKKWWSTANMVFSIRLKERVPTFPKKGYAKLRVPFDLSKLLDFIADDITRNMHSLAMHVLLSKESMSAEAQAALKSNKAAFVTVPIDINVRDWVESYIHYVLRPVKNSIHKIMFVYNKDNSIDSKLEVHLDKEALDRVHELVDDMDVDDLMDFWSNEFDDKLVKYSDLNLKEATAKW